MARSSFQAGVTGSRASPGRSLDPRLKPRACGSGLVRDRGGRDRPGQPRNALYAIKVVDGRVQDVAPGARTVAVELPVRSGDWEDLGRDDAGNLWVGDVGNNECDRDDTALLKVREPDPAAGRPATVLAT